MSLGLSRVVGDRFAGTVLSARKEKHGGWVEGFSGSISDLELGYGLCSTGSGWPITALQKMT
jgi:hypothetical protein